MTGATATRASTPRPSIGGYPLTDLSAVAGALVWAAAALFGELTAVERTLALAPLVVVPLGLGLATDGRFDGVAGRALAAATALQPVGAVSVLFSLVLPSGTTAALAAVAWVPVPVAMAVAGLSRAFDRGLRPLDLPETLVDAGLAYTPVAAVSLVLFHLGITFWFDPVIVFLTAVHFHYAGFALPVVAGVTGRYLGDPGGLFRWIGAVVLAGPAIIAVGISFSPLVEFAAVGVFTVAVAAFGGYVVVRVVPRCSPLSAALVGLSALALPVSMLLALSYGVAVFTGTDPLGLHISRMVSLHGSLNAYGFALLGVVGWRLAGSAGDIR